MDGGVRGGDLTSDGVIRKPHLQSFRLIIHLIASGKRDYAWLWVFDEVQTSSRVSDLGSCRTAGISTPSQNKTKNQQQREIVSTVRFCWDILHPAGIITRTKVRLFLAIQLEYSDSDKHF